RAASSPSAVASSVPGRRSMVTMPSSMRTSLTMPSVTTSRRKLGKITPRSAVRTPSGVRSAMRATVLGGSVKGHATRVLDLAAGFPLSPAVAAEPRAQGIASAPTAAIPAEVQDDLARVEERLLAEITSREPRLGEIAHHLVGAGGKRVRPLVV